MLLACNVMPVCLLLRNPQICNGMLPDILSRDSLTRPSLISASPLHHESRGLQDVMTIRRVPLQERSSSQQTCVVLCPVVC